MKHLVISGIVLVILFSCTGKKSMSNDERFRPQLHFSEGVNWTGEPSAAVYYEGEYHLFFQYNPEQATFGNIHWGHATSSDLVHWEKSAIAIFPEPSGQIYSGSVVVDIHNSSGLGSKESPVFVAYYIYRNSTTLKQSLSMAYSHDEGQSWIECDDLVLNASEKTSLRNPNVSWNNMTKQWLMTVSTGSTIQLYASSDCKQWSYLSEFDNSFMASSSWESSSLFPLKITDSHITKWVLTVNAGRGSANGTPSTRYFIGDFDGVEFKMEQNQELWIDYGKDSNAAVIFNNVPTDRKIMIGWMDSWDYANETPTETWRGSMTFPRELRLTKEENHYLLASTPIIEINDILQDSKNIASNIELADKQIYRHNSFPKSPFVLRLSFDNSNRYALWGAKDYGVRLNTKSGKTLTLGYKADLSYYYINRAGLIEKPFSDSFEQLMGAAYTNNKSRSDWDILYDNGSVELFINGGEVVMTSLFYTEEDFTFFELFAESGKITLIDASIAELNIEKNKKINE